MMDWLEEWRRLFSSETMRSHQVCQEASRETWSRDSVEKKEASCCGEQKLRLDKRALRITWKCRFDQWNF